MLDVHPPHHAAATWRDFFIHIATIVIGLLIAISLEQAVEAIHHRHQAEQTEAALRKECVENRDIAHADIETIRVLIANLRDNREGLRSAPMAQESVAYEWRASPPGKGWLPLVDSAWLTARDSAVFSLLPGNLVKDRWRVQWTIEQTNTLGLDYFNTLFNMRSEIHQHGSEVRLTSEERADAIRELTSLDGKLRHLYSTMLYFEDTNELYLGQQEINLKNLEQRQQSRAQPPSW